MKLEKELSEVADDMKNQLKAYAELRMELIKVEASGIVAKNLGQVIASLIIALIVLFVILFVSIAGGFYFSAYFGSYTQGFGVIASFYVAIGLLLLLAKNSLIAKPITNSIITKIFEDETQ